MYSNYEADLLDAMADRAHELEEAMRSSEQSEWIYVDRGDGIVSIDMIDQQVGQSEFTLIDPMEDMHDDESN